MSQGSLFYELLVHSRTVIESSLMVVYDPQET